ncbi:MAG TPA: EAL domain-containing protein [Gammaproteobacteria bacterium]|nr:EAL domain-containing protein [Gammaproteobacteria bacterium]
MTDDQRISVTGALILAALTLAAGIAVFVVMQRQSQQVLNRSLQMSLQARSSNLADTIHRGVRHARTVASPPFLLTRLKALNRTPDDPDARAALAEAAQSLVANGFSAIAFFDRRGDEIGTWGRFAERPQLRMALHTTPPAWLLQAGGILLHVEVPITDGGRALGHVVTEARLPAVEALFAHVRSLGKTGDLALCSPLADAARMTCFATTLTHHVFPSIARRRDGAPLPMSYALDGQQGVITTRDYRGQQVKAAYAPVDHLGPGLVLKMDTAELYAPVTRQLRFIVPLLAALLLLGAALLRWQVLPLVRKLVSSERLARESMARLQDSEARIRAIFQGVPDALITLDETGHVESVNPAAERVFGYPPSTLVGTAVARLIPGMEASLWSTHTGGARASSGGREVIGLRRDGSEVPLELHVSHMLLADRQRTVCALHDITQRKTNEQRILQLASHDPLTGLPNRTLLGDRIEQAIAHGRRNRSGAAVLFIDLDHFKTINDSLGHETGDRLLRAVGARIADQLREADTVARQGGDEFIVVVPGVAHADDAALAAEKILAALGEPFRVNGRELHTSASIGVSLFPDDGDTVRALLQSSDTAMYHAKAAGRGIYQFFTPRMNAMAAERLTLESRLRRAVEREDLSLHYQPVVDLTSGRIASVEALLRWRDADGVWIPPAKFVPIAEDIGLIEPIGHWVLHTACRQLNAWLAAGLIPGRMAVNLSLRQLRGHAAVEWIGRVLEDNGVAARHLELEITESVLMDNPEHTIALLDELGEMGVQLSIDDFGTGYSSLSYLKRLPIHRLKIDMSFIRDVVSDSDDAAIVGAILAMAHSLGLRVVAEGVETEGQWRFLRARGCDEYQGDYFSPPMSGEQIALLLPRSRAAT